MHLPETTLKRYASISPIAAWTYAIGHGWREQADHPFPDAWRLLPPEGYDQRRVRPVILPNKIDKNDYLLALETLIFGLSETTEKSVDVVSRDILFANQDIIRFRSLRGLELGNIDVDSCISFYKNIRMLLLSVTYAAWHPRPVYYFRRGAPDVVRQFLFAPAEAGSHIANVIIHPDVPNPRISPNAAPAYCRPAQTLDRAIQAVVQATINGRRDGDFRHFSDHIQDGLSANFCDSLAELMDSDQLTMIDIKWSLTAIVPPKAQGRHRLDPAIPTILREAAKEFRRTETRETETFEGTVIRLTRENSDGPGTATLRLDVDERTRPVKVTAKGKLYKQLATAHRDGHGLQIIGKLREEAGHLHLSEPHLLATFPLDD